MHLNISDTPDQSGLEAAIEAERILQDTLAKQKEARLLLSTGASQFQFLKHFTARNIDWSRIEMFHLDEYIGLPESHPASFRKYLKERFLRDAKVKRAYLVDGEGAVPDVLKSLKEEIARAPIDLALIGIGENGHIAFNDPPADFDIEEPYMAVDLNDSCKDQQVGEGWFASRDEVPKQAITMTVKQIMKSRHILSVVPHGVKAEAVRNTMQKSVDPQFPSTILKTHPHWQLYLDQASASLIYQRG
ncbi:glucosamine-6-phosphate deaminase [Cohnella sp. GbtcB17]|uniref:glucosamine-6-phosphate deaminase n=1 Tax=Cohnella sp. GbtcB17 TaxID=2824762 RepID=UPI001C2FE7C1|nr:glucosamine-6-phosphate deaminase [Cohnella sp. GbtcB17]